MNTFNYENKEYLSKLDQLKETYYSKYIREIKKRLKSENDKFLDVGFGSGTVLSTLKQQGYKNGYGIEISKLFVKEGKKKGIGNLRLYNGVKIPFAESFSLIGSFNVLEHTEFPEKFLEEQIKKTKKGGIIIVACPNFLSVFFPSRHRRLRGIKNKLRNLLLILAKFLSNESSFEKMEPLIKKKFEYDDDAIVVTNLIDLEKLFLKNRCRIVYESGFVNYDSFLFKLINNIPFMKYMLPSCFIVAQKI